MPASLVWKSFMGKLRWIKVFPNQLRIYFQSIFIKRNCPPRTILPTETVSRFVFDRKHFDKNTHQVLGAAFEPAPGTKGLSVYRIDGLIPFDIWEIGKYFVAYIRVPSMKGRGDLLVENVLNADFDIESSLFPHPRHSDIIRWPDNNILVAQKALRLANESTRMHPVPPSFPL